MSLRVVLMGTGDFPVPAFRAILESDHPVVGIFTQPDREGAGHHRHQNAVRDLAVSAGVFLFQPPQVNSEESLDVLRTLAADVLIVASYGQILRPSLLSIPRLGAFNIHGSLLPRHRGAAPVQYAIWKGDTETGITIFQIERTLDSGPMVGKIGTEIGPHETSGELLQRLAALSAPLSLQVLQQLENGTAVFELQNPGQVTLAPRILKADGIINWGTSCSQIDCHVRAMQPWPKASTCLVRSHKTLMRCLILDVQRAGLGTPVPNQTGAAGRHTSNISLPTGGSPGTLFTQSGRLWVAAADGWVEILRIQPEGRRAMESAAFLNGHAIEEGDSFGNDVK